MSDYSPAAAFVAATVKLDLPLPQPVLDAHDRHSALLTVQRDRLQDRTATVTELSDALAVAGADPVKLRKALTGDVALRLAACSTRETGEALAAAAYQADVALRRAILEHGDDVVLGWRPTVQQAGAVITAAARTLQHVDNLDDYEAVARTGADAAEHWSRATAATAQLTKVGQLLDALHGLGYDLVPQPGALVRTEVVRMVALTWQHVEDRSALTLWSAAHTGLPITLHTSAELRDVMVRIVTDREANLTAAERHARSDDCARAAVVASWSNAG